MSDFDAIMDAFDGANPREAGGGGNKIKVDGRHRVRITACKLQESEVRDAVYFVAEFELVQTNRDNDLVVGNSYSWTCDLKRRFGQKKVGANDVAAFLVAAAGYDPENAPAMSGQDLKDAVEKDQPLAGRLVDLETTRRLNQAETHSWTQHIWSPVREDG